jgi:hypothetical protein
MEFVGALFPELRQICVHFDGGIMEFNIELYIAAPKGSFIRI